MLGVRLAVHIVLVWPTCFLFWHGSVYVLRVNLFLEHDMQRHSLRQAAGWRFAMATTTASQALGWSQDYPAPRTRGVVSSSLICCSRVDLVDNWLQMFLVGRRGVWFFFRYDAARTLPRTHTSAPRAHAALSSEKLSAAMLSVLLRLDSSAAIRWVRLFYVCVWPEIQRGRRKKLFLCVLYVLSLFSRPDRGSLIIYHIVHSLSHCAAQFSAGMWVLSAHCCTFFFAVHW